MQTESWSVVASVSFLHFCCSLFLFAREQRSVFTMRSQFQLVCFNDRWGDEFNEMNSDLELSAERSNWEWRACAIWRTYQDRLVATYGENKGEHRKRAHGDYSDAFSMFDRSVKSVTHFKTHASAHLSWGAERIVHVFWGSSAFILFSFPNAEVGWQGAGIHRFPCLCEESRGFAMETPCTPCVWRTGGGKNWQSSKTGYLPVLINRYSSGNLGFRQIISTPLEIIKFSLKRGKTIWVWLY